MEKEKKRLEREEKRKIQELEQRRKKDERELRKGEKAKEREVPKRQLRKKKEREPEIDSDGSSDEAVCPMCGLTYSVFWICCDGCNQWFDIKCTTIKSKKHVPDVYYCEK